MSIWDHMAADAKQILADTDGPGFTATVTAPGVAAVADCRVGVEERPQGFIPGEGGNTTNHRVLAITISPLDVPSVLRSTTVVLVTAPFVGTWKVEYIESRNNAAVIAICTLDKTLGVHGAGVRAG